MVEIGAGDGVLTREGELGGEVLGGVAVGQDRAQRRREGAVGGEESP